MYKTNKSFRASKNQVIGFALVLITCLYSMPIFSMEALTLGIFPRRSSIETMKMFIPIVNHLNKRLQIKIKLIPSKDFPTFWQRVKDKEFDIVHFNQYHYVKAHEELEYDVFAVNEEFGESTITGSVIVRKDSGINTVKDLKGKHIVFGGGKMAMQSYIYATYLLMEQGLSTKEYTYSIAPTPPNAIFATYYKQADAGGVGDKVLKLHSVSKHIDTNQIKYLVRGKQYPHLPWAMKRSLSDDIKQKIALTMVNMKSTMQGKKLLKKANLTGFVQVDDKDFNPHRKIIMKVMGADY